MNLFIYTKTQGVCCKVGRPINAYGGANKKISLVQFKRGTIFLVISTLADKLRALADEVEAG